MNFLIKPWDHQLKAFERAKDKPHYGLFFEVGAGKTPVAINLLRYKYAQAKEVLKTLIIVPPNVLYNWVDEFGKHSKVVERVVVLDGSQIERQSKLVKALARKQNIHITSYTSLHMGDKDKGLVKDLMDVGYGIFIADEFHRLRNTKAKQTKVARKLVDGDKRTKRPAIPHRLGLTGSPVLQNGGLDLWSLFRILDGGKLLGDNFRAFRSIYFTDENAEWAGKPSYFPKWVARPDTASKLNKLIYSIASRVLKKDCMDLPPFVRQIIRVGMSKEQQRNYKEMKDDYIAVIRQAKKSGQSPLAVAQLAITQSIRLRQIVTGFVTLDDGNIHSYTDNPRGKALRETLEDLAPYNKVIVWACFKQNYEVIRQACLDLSLEFVEINGEISDPRQKHINAKRFNEDPNVRVCIANQASAGEGMNLQASNYSLYYSRSHSLLENEQSEARNYRGGSEIHDKVTRIDLVTEGTIDELILNALAEHKKVAEAILAIAK